MLSEIDLNTKYYAFRAAEIVEPVFVKNNWVTFLYDDGSSGCIGISAALDEWKDAPPEPEKLFIVYSRQVKQDLTEASHHLYKSKEHFLDYNNCKESDFEFIRLREVKFDEN